MNDRQDAAQRKRAIVDDARRAASISDISAAWDAMKPLWGRWQDAGFAGEEEQALRTAYDADEERQERERQQYQAKEYKLWLTDQLRTWIGSSDRARAWSEVKAIQGKFRGAGYAGKEHSADLNVAFSRAFEDFRLWSNSEIHKEIMGKLPATRSGKPQRPARWMRCAAGSSRCRAGTLRIRETPRAHTRCSGASRPSARSRTTSNPSARSGTPTKSGSWSCARRRPSTARQT